MDELSDLLQCETELILRFRKLDIKSRAAVFKSLYTALNEDYLYDDPVVYLREIVSKAVEQFTMIQD